MRTRGKRCRASRAVLSRNAPFPLARVLPSGCDAVPALHFERLLPLLRLMVVLRFLSDLDRLRMLFSLCAARCPHRLVAGFLILHSFLYGYRYPDSSARMLRGQRVFCSNRGRRKGCGRTFSVYLDTTIPRHYRHMPPQIITNNSWISSWSRALCLHSPPCRPKTCGITSLKNPTSYLRMRVLGAIDMAQGNSISARIKAVSEMTFHDEEGHPRRFTWRTIQRPRGSASSQ